MELNGISMEKMKSFSRERDSRVLVRQSFQPASAEKRIISDIVAKMGKGEDVSMESLRKICIALDCEIGDIMEVNAGIGEEK